MAGELLIFLSQIQFAISTILCYDTDNLITGAQEQRAKK
ncbi:hypothetical protein HMPREF9102_0677 [Limosilactobacillus oris F0423]|uniref:Uncharacterized protein n=2 Tax=Limosilactobacillus oris TaxID=1632 RepID=E3C9E2_9LACO|nr:hypothetical protein HMPREF9265_1544 [Limosilactobacillus oris PB013-T2-3]EGS39579.1 hypothetical protein HMPREF9102_0677 [Limosilactobacillus oris F0423]